MTDEDERNTAKPVPVEQEAPTRYTGGLESQLDGIAAILFWLGVIAGVVAVILSIEYDVSLFSGVAVFLSAVVTWAILRALAELVRLQKKANGLPYAGQISEARPNIIYRCDGCNEVVHENDRVCASCGGTLKAFEN